jgi:hypothetical protein
LAEQVDVAPATSTQCGELMRRTVHAGTVADQGSAGCGSSPRPGLGEVAMRFAEHSRAVALRFEVFGEVIRGRSR